MVFPEVMTGIRPAFLEETEFFNQLSA